MGAEDYAQSGASFMPELPLSRLRLFWPEFFTF